MSMNFASPFKIHASKDEREETPSYDDLSRPVQSDQSDIASLSEYDERVSAEIDYVTQTVQRSLDRLVLARATTAATSILLPLAILFLGWTNLWTGPHPSSIGQMTFVEMTIIVGICFMTTIYALELARRRREISRLSRTTMRQVDEAKQMLRTLTSWLDRAEMSFQLRKVLMLRVATLDALISEARSATSTRSLFID